MNVDKLLGKNIKLRGIIAVKAWVNKCGVGFQQVRLVYRHGVNMNKRLIVVNLKGGEKEYMKKISIGLATAALLISMTAGAAFASSSEGNIGNGQGQGKDLDINAYCLHTGKGPDSSIIIGTQDWTCSNNGVGSPVSLHAVCQYEWSLNSVKELREGDALSWQCFK